MDWIKVLNKHILFEYNDLRDSEFVAWIKIMALTASLEKMPTHEQMLKQAHHKTLTSLQDKLKTRSITLQDILKRVLIDVQEVVERKTYWKMKQKEKREYSKNVNIDVNKMSNDRYREEKIKIKNKINKGDFILPDWISKDTWDAFLEMRKAKRAATTERAKQMIVRELGRLKGEGYNPEDVLNQSIMRSWTGVFPLTEDRHGRRDTVGGFRKPQEYTGETFEISDQERERNLAKLKGITGKIGGLPD